MKTLLKFCKLNLPQISKRKMKRPIIQKWVLLVLGFSRQNESPCAVWAPNLGLGKKSNIPCSSCHLLSSFFEFFSWLAVSNSPSSCIVAYCFCFSSDGFFIFHAALRVGSKNSVGQPSQLTFTCLKSTLEILEKGMKYIES